MSPMTDSDDDGGGGDDDVSLYGLFHVVIARESCDSRHVIAIN